MSDADIYVSRLLRRDTELSNAIRVITEQVDDNPPYPQGVENAPLSTVLEQNGQALTAIRENGGGELLTAIDAVYSQAPPTLNQTITEAQTTVNELVDNHTDAVAAEVLADGTTITNTLGDIRNISSAVLEGADPDSGDSFNGGGLSAEPAVQGLRDLVAAAGSPAYGGDAQNDPIGDLVAYLYAQQPTLNAP